MNRPRAAWLLPLLAAALACRGKAPAAARGPNILVVTIDTIRADRVGAYGSSVGATPAIDAFAKEGVVFEQAIAPAPLTLPSHTTLFSGFLPFRTGVRVNGTDRVTAKVPLLAEAFADRGYRTAAFVSTLVLKSSSGIGRGFALYDDAFEANNGKDARSFVSERRGDETVGRALAWLAKKAPDQAAPFFLWVHLYDPHAPYAPPAPYAEQFRGREYDGEVAFADACFGRLLASVDAADTLVVLAGDHGESLGEHGEQGHGVFLYDATIRVPLILRLPGKAFAGTRVAAQVRLADVAPTLRRMAALAPVEADGEDLGPLLSNPASADRPAFSESDYPAFVLGWSPMRALRLSGRKLIDAPRRELYDLRADAGEAHNLYAGEEEAARGLARELKRITERKALTEGSSSAADPEAARRLASLGYISVGAAAVDYDRIDASRVDPKDHVQAWAKIEAGLLARNSGDFEKTVALLEWLLDSYPTLNPVILRDYAEACRQTGRLDRAIELYEKILKTAGPGAGDFLGVGVAWHLKGDDAKAAENLERAVALDPANKSAWVDLGSAQLSLRNFDAARDAFAKAAALDPRSARALSGLASVALSKKDYGLAEGLLQTAVGLEPGNDELRFNLALVKRARGDSVGARAIYTALTKSKAPEVSRRATQELQRSQ